MHCNGSLTRLPGYNGKCSIDVVAFEILRHTTLRTKGFEKLFTILSRFAQVVSVRKFYRCSQTLNPLLPKKSESRNRKKIPKNSITTDYIRKKVRWCCRIQVSQDGKFTLIVENHSVEPQVYVAATFSKTRFTFALFPCDRTVSTFDYSIYRVKMRKRNSSLCLSLCDEL